MRLYLAPTSALTDARGHNERPALTAWQRQARAVVSTLKMIVAPPASQIKARGRLMRVVFCCLWRWWPRCMPLQAGRQTLGGKGRNRPLMRAEVVIFSLSARRVI